MMYCCCHLIVNDCLKCIEMKIMKYLFFDHLPPFTLTFACICKSLKWFIIAKPKRMIANTRLEYQLNVKECKTNVQGDNCKEWR